MKRLALLLVFCCTALTASQAATTEIVRNAIGGFIIPGYEQFVGEAELQAFTIDRLCTTPGSDQLAAAQTQFRALVTAWSRMDTIRFGPVLKDNRLERILFWPDRKSTGLKQVQSAIARKDETVTSVETLQSKSVALQGLGALEFALFGTGADDLATSQGAHRCQYAHAIAEALYKTGNEIVADWLADDGIASHMAAPKPDYADYRTEEEVMRELMGIFIHGAELMRDTRIIPFLGQTPKQSKPKSALFWRSSLTIAALRANVEGMRDLFLIAGLADALKQESRWAAGSFVFEIESFVRVAGEADKPIAEALQQTELRDKINYLRIVTRSMQKLATEQIAADLGLTVGFSALDGD